MTTFLPITSIYLFNFSLSLLLHSEVLTIQTFIIQINQIILVILSCLHTILLHRINSSELGFILIFFSPIFFYLSFL